MYTLPAIHVCLWDVNAGYTITPYVARMCNTYVLRIVLILLNTCLKESNVDTRNVSVGIRTRHVCDICNISRKVLSYL